MEQFELIRKDYDMGLSVRAIAVKHGVHRRKVREAIGSSIPPEPKVPCRVPTVLTVEVTDFIEKILTEDQKAHRKQRHTAHRIFQRVRDELEATPAESTVRGYVGQRRRELAIGQRAFVAQHHEIGAQGEVDFYEADFDFPWGRQRAQIIALRSEFSAGARHVAYPAQNQGSFLEGIELGLRFLGGVFAVVRFDNLKLAVKKVLRGGRRLEADTFIAFRSHYLFEASFATPGIEGAHEKGGIEGENGRFRRRWLTPVPSFSSWEEANEYLLACCIADMDRRLPGREMTVGEAMAAEAKVLRALPAEGFELGEVSEPRVDQQSRVRVRNNFYSVPASLVGRRVSVRTTPMAVEVAWSGRVVARHERLHLKYAESLVLDHYLDVLIDKPGAFPGSLALHQARSRGEFPASYDEAWAKLKARQGERDGTRAMIEVLLAHRAYPKDVMVAAVAKALAMGAVNPASIELLAHNAVAGEPVQLSMLEVGELARYARALPDLSPYDQLLGCGCGVAS
ncbi:MAG: IS21 family transposase [Actinomycetota bacterium]